jgi:hypothetical protein
MDEISGVLTATNENEELIEMLRKGRLPYCVSCVWFGRHNSGQFYCRKHQTEGYVFVQLKAVQEEYPACSKFIPMKPEDFQ